MNTGFYENDETQPLGIIGLGHDRHRKQMGLGTRYKTPLNLDTARHENFMKKALELDGDCTAGGIPVVPNMARIRMLFWRHLNAKQRTNVLTAAGFPSDQPFPQVIESMLIDKAHQQGNIHIICEEMKNYLPSNVEVYDPLSDIQKRVVLDAIRDTAYEMYHVSEQGNYSDAYMLCDGLKDLNTLPDIFIFMRDFGVTADEMKIFRTQIDHALASVLQD